MFLHKKKIIALLLIAIVIAGCSSSSEPIKSTLTENEPVQIEIASEPQGPPEKMISDDGEWLGKGDFYKIQYPELLKGIKQIYVCGDDIYYSAVNFYEYLTQEIYKNEEVLYENRQLSTFAVSDSSVWYITKDYIDNRIFTLTKLGINGEEEASIDISSYVGDSLTASMRIDNKNNFYIQTMESVIILNPDGSYQTTIVSDDIEELLSDGNGNVYALNEDGTTVMTMDLENGTIQPYLEYPDYRIYHGNSEYQFILSDSNGIYGITGPQEPVPIALWEECRIIMNDIRSVDPLSNGSYLIRDSEETYLLVPSEPEELKPRTILTMATVTTQSYYSLIVKKYNSTSDEYYIRIQDYSQGNSLSPQEAENALNTDISTGNYPDLFDFTMMTEAYYTSENLVADLYTFIDNDPETDRDDFILLDNLSENGKLYYISTHYFIDTIAGLYSRFGDLDGWSLDEFLEMQEQCDIDMMYNLTRENFLHTLSKFYAGSTIDWNAGTCDFENEDFIKILETVKQIRENPEPSRSWELNLITGAQGLGEETLIVSSILIDNMGSLVEAEAKAGKKLSFIGWPTSDGSSGTVLSPSDFVGICTMGNTEASWDFIKYVLIDGSIREYVDTITNSKALLEQQLKENPSSIVMTQEDVERFYDFLDTAVYHGKTPTMVQDIIMEEGALYLSGEKTAKETARNIQDRVSDLIAN